MPKAIVDTKLSGDLIANPDVIWSAEALPDSTTKLSEEFTLGQTLAGVEIKVVAVAGATLAGTLDIELQSALESGGSFVTERKESYGIGDVIAAGDDIAKFIIPRERSVSAGMFSILKLSTSDSDQAVTVDAYPVFIS